MSTEPDKEQLRRLIQAVLVDNKDVLEPQKPTSDEHHAPWWVKIFGSAIVVITASVLIGIVQNLYSNVHELSTELKRTNEKIISKEEFNASKTSQWSTIRECQDKTNKLLATEERLKLSEERLKKLEVDNAALRDTVTRVEEQVKTLKAKEKP